MQKNNHNGFTLVEVLISILLLTIVLVGGMGFCFNSQEEMTLVVHKKIAAEMANSKMEEFKRKKYSDLPGPAASPGVVVENNNTQLGSPINKGGYISANTADALGTKVTVTDVDDPVGGAIDYKEVKVEVKWKEAGKKSEQNIVLVTYLAP